jgi:hypothetical protein
MKKQAKIYSGGWVEAKFDMPAMGSSKEYWDENGQGVKVSYWGKKDIICAFFSKEQLQTNLYNKYQTLTEAANAILAWNKAYRVY